MGKNSARWILFLLIPFLLTGCWDRMEIEKRGFVMAIGIDIVSNTEAQKKDNKEVPAAQEGKKQTRYSVTYQVAIPAKLQSGQGSGGGGGGGSSSSGKPYINITSEGHTLFETVRILSTRSSRSPYFEHNKVFVIGENLARSGQLPDVVDLLLRDHEMRRRMKVVVVKGTAKEALNVSAQQERLTSKYLDSLTENSERTTRMPQQLTIGNLQEKLMSTQSFVAQRVIPKQKEVKMAGTAVFHGYDDKLIGWLGEEETEGLMWLTGDVKRGIVEAALPSGDLIVYEIRKSRTKVEPIVANGSYTFKVRIQTEGSLGESYAGRDALSEDFNQELEKAVEQNIIQLTTGVIQKLQTELKVDAIGLGGELARKQPQVWNKIKDDWDHDKNYFSQAKIDVEVEAKVLFPGVITSLTD